MLVGLHPFDFLAGNFTLPVSMTTLTIREAALHVQAGRRSSMTARAAWDWVSEKGVDDVPPRISPERWRGMLLSLRDWMEQPDMSSYCQD